MSSKSTNKTNCSRSSSARSKHGARVVAQTPIDAQLHVNFEESERHFDYSASVDFNISSSTSDVPSSTVSAYLQKMQRGNLIQPFGCMIAVDEQNLTVLAYSENAPEMLDLAPHAPFYAILHRIDVGLIIDLEPVNPADVPVTAAGALKSYKLAAKAISRLQSLPSGNISLLCDVLVKEASELTGYDRVMVYKFHEDEHGEVIADLCGSTLRSPHGCHAQYMANMGSVASLVMSVTINEEDDDTESEQQKGRKLWGLVVCHNTSPRFVPFPLRYACEFLVQVFGVQISKEMELAAQMKEKHILQTQTVLCDMLLRDAPVGIVTQSPNVMDLVRCDGAALYYQKKFWLLGVTPTEAQIRDIVEWLLEYHSGSTGLSTDSLMEAGYPAASVLGDAVCGIAAVKINSNDFLFWFRSHTAKEIKWASVPILAVDAAGCINGWNNKAAELTGLIMQQAIGMPLINLVENDSADMVKKMLSMALQGIEEQNVEIKLKTFGPQENNGPVILVVNACCSRDIKDNVVGVCFVGQDITGQKMVMDKYTRIQGDYVGIVRNPSALIPPIFMMDEHGRCLEWNDAMQNLSGLKREEATDRMLLGEVFTVNNFGCQVKDHDTLTKLRILLNGAIAGQDAQKLLFGFFDQHGKYIEALLSANKRTDAEGKITGVLCFLHVASPELQHAMQVQRISEQAAADSLKKLAYIRQQIRKPLNGIMFIQNLMDSSELSQDQKKFLRTSMMCQEQLTKIVDDTDLESIEECYMELNSGEFNLGEVLEVVISQAMILSRERRVEIIYDSPAEVSSMLLYGDNLRLQQVLSDFLTNALLFTPAFEGSSVALRVIPRRECIGTKVHIVHLEFRIAHPAPGIPEDLIQQMFHHSQGVSREGLGLYINQKLVKIMNGTVQYLREAQGSSFIILIEFPLAH
ncbi:unnamed protein product, partial [Vitis vinifera]